MDSLLAGFDWDEGNWPKCGKHGVTKAEIEVFFQLEPAVRPDPYKDEPRLQAIGKSITGRYIFLVFMYRTKNDQTFIRPISARYMRQREIDHYEKKRRQADAVTPE
jgi:uncharacterized DUF497 family protein